MPTPGDDAASPVNIPNWLAQQGESAEEFDFPQEPVTHDSENLETSVEYEAASDDHDPAETSNDPAGSSTYDGDASPSYPPSPPQQPTLIRDPRIATAVESTRNAIEQYRKIPDWYEIVKAYTARPGEKTKEDSDMLFQLLDNAAKRDLYKAQELQARMSEIRVLVAERHISIPRAVGDYYSPTLFNQSLWTMREGPTWATTPMAPPVTIFKRPLHNLSRVPFAGPSFRYSSNPREANPSSANESTPRPHSRDHSPASFNRYPWTMREGPTWATTPMAPPVSILKRPRTPAHEGGAVAPLQGPAEADAKPKVPDFSWVLSARPSDRHPSNRPEAGPSRATESLPHTSAVAGDSQPPRKRRRVRDYSYIRYPTVSELAERLRAREDLLLAEAHRPHSGFNFVWPPV
ncbi:hypothetical protein C8R46DRAFT_1245269 [Mycena filopes]|nr:hypothetical protein C8R46DRAFT_1245269 [Mycena filopes]